MADQQTSKFAVGNTVEDRSGFRGVITSVTCHDGSVWYDVRFDRGVAVRYDSDLELVA